MKKSFLFLAVVLSILLISKEGYSQDSQKILPTSTQSKYDMKWIFLNLNVDKMSTYLSGDVTLKSQVIVPILDTFSFHLANYYTIDSLKVNNQIQPFITNGHERLITGLTFNNGTIFDVQVFYHGSSSGSGGFFSGISSATHWSYPAFRTTWTLSEPNAAYQWFPIKQVLTDKIDSVRFYATTAIGNRVGCNGRLMGIDTLPNNKVRFRWNSNQYPIDYYLISFAVADYQDYSYSIQLPGVTAPLLIQNYIYNSTSCLNATKTVIDKVGEMIQFFSETYGTYPFVNDKYGHTYAPMGGAMEHQTMTTTGYFEESIIAHELAHQWFGDKVTCASWEYIFVNESFAAYSAFLWEEYAYGTFAARNTFQNIRNNVLASALTGSVYVPVSQIDNENRIFNGTLSYNKGATVLHLLRFILGDDLFKEALQTYLNTHAYSTGTIDDFKEAVESVVGTDFDYFFDQWIYGEGYPEFDLTWQQVDNKFRIKANQTTTAPSITPFFQVPFEVKLTYSNGGGYDIVTFNQTVNNQAFQFTIPYGKHVSYITFNPNYWLLAKVNTVLNGEVEFDDSSIESVIAKEVVLYPNPATDQAIVAATSSISKVVVFDVAGKSIQVLLFDADPQVAIDLQNMTPGIYFLRITTEKGVVTRKLMVTD
ncbi:MAG: T9SS type A sorting domain-containing protein [Bacteroidales bacterium]|nr:T9SS type A sorting domain-containing protein [Bacteroidales bacterium]